MDIAAITITIHDDYCARADSDEVRTILTSVTALISNAVNHPAGPNEPDAV